MDNLTLNEINVRKTEDSLFSVFDAIQFIAQKGNQRKVWERLCESHPEVLENVVEHKFPGAGQRPTPVADKATIIEIIGLLPPERPQRLDDKGSVYLIATAEVPIVKIGKSINPIVRLAAHQVSSPMRLKLVKSVKVKMMTDTERALKEFFKRYRSHGEWYRIGIDKACLLFDEAIAACQSFQEVAQYATPQELERLAELMSLQTKALQKENARGHTEISKVVQSAADEFQAFLSKFGVI